MGFSRFLGLDLIGNSGVGLISFLWVSMELGFSGFSGLGLIDNGGVGLISFFMGFHGAAFFRR